MVGASGGVQHGREGYGPRVRPGGGRLAAVVAGRRAGSGRWPRGGSAPLVARPGGEAKASGDEHGQEQVDATDKEREQRRVRRPTRNGRRQMDKVGVGKVGWTL
jgi:hypothetical protein